jgi:hypothetical protein
MFSAMRPEGTDRRGMKRTPRRLTGMFIAVAALAAVIPASAQAIGLSGLSVTPASHQAGAHSDIGIHIGFTTPADQVKNLTISLPPGVVGDPNATPHCTVAQLNADACDPKTEVGSVSTNLTLQILAPLISLPLTVNGTLYNLDPKPGEPARFGIVLHALPITIPVLGPAVVPNIILQSGVALRQSDFGLDTVIKDIPHSATVLGVSREVDITGMTVTLDGKAPGTGKSFMRNPTSCKTHTTNFAATSYSGSTTTNPAHGSASFTTNGCANEDFSPSFSASVGGPGQTTVGNPTTASTSINQDTDEAGLIKATVLVPGDLAPNVNLLGFRCPPANFQAGTCPATSIMGTAIAASPLLTQPLVGNVELVDNGGLLPNIGLDLQGQLHLLLQGALNADKSVVFDGLPDIPIARFQLAFSNPPGLLMPNRDLCTPPPPLFHADFVGYNGATASVDAPAVVNGCGAGNGANAGKCKKHKAKKKKHKHRAAESKKKHKKKHSCKKKKRHKKHRK